ncbi:hypothetical protein [Rhizobium leguminosarum]|uniref:hypothetical protein n=1 Tax=Rhizobium leguminosarum TaxID=384 RepID=UPI0013BE0B00|nr:hypothetical protein [Rhizobium leguminosarum]NEI60926.1 hypothetical protein [Rhizobium leguminosarum]
MSIPLSSMTWKPKGVPRSKIATADVRITINVSGDAPLVDGWIVRVVEEAVNGQIRRGGRGFKTPEAP